MTVNHLTVRKYRLPVIAALLAACAGSVDVFAFFGVGNAFAGIVTGNLVTASYGIASGDAALIRPTVTAVAGCILGELAWAAHGRAPRRSNVSSAAVRCTRDTIGARPRRSRAP